jgi:hypothetical protein
MSLLPDPVFLRMAAVITTTLLYLVDWEAESIKAQALVLKADLAEAAFAGVGAGVEDEYDPPQDDGKYRCTQQIQFMPRKIVNTVYSIPPYGGNPVAELTRH